MNKAAVANLLVKANAFAPFRFLNRGKLPILMYHRFSVEEEFGKTSKRVFERHLRYLTHHYKIISLGEAVARLRDGSLPARSAVITIDDGYNDFYEIAFPVLKAYGLPATLYVVTGFVDGSAWIWTDKARYILGETVFSEINFKVRDVEFHKDLGGRADRMQTAGALNAELKKLSDGEKDRLLTELAKDLNIYVPDSPPNEFGPLSWERVNELTTNGIEIGSHTASHPILTNVEPERLKGELTISRSVISEKIQKDVSHFCYPNGNASQRERDAVKEAGYSSAVTTEIRLSRDNDDRFMLPRIDAEPEMHRFIQATSGFDRVKTSV